ncbi:FecR domain-containing protein [Luteimonas sp. Y-2-2-4F]|nr:FecR domain-containing protein [Luteimonas sp. Y-2-2-4F]MCD9030617.1 FecR domain-containing protein [Luteimonas sp. Y-2-2-4F]
MRAEAEAPLPASVIEEAVDWLLVLHSGRATDADRAACARWRDGHPERQQAWRRAERLRGLLSAVPADLARPVLGRPADARRRAAVKRLAALLAAAPGAWLAWRLSGDAGWRADVRTATGERRSLTLPDGSRLDLNTATSMDIAFGPEERLLRLHTGEIAIDTGADPWTPARPFRVATPQGQVEALGTRFSVRVDGTHTRVAVLQGAVRLEPADGPGTARVLQAGQQAAFDAVQAEAPTTTDERALAWVHGMLAADAMPLADLLAELARHRRGLLRCDPEVAGLRVSGAFPLDDTARSLAMLEATYPVRVRSTAGGYWTVVGPPR